MNIAIPLHVLSFVIWIGGMFFAYMALRPVAASQLQPPARLTLWVGVFARFFPWVWVAVVLLFATGLWMIFSVYGGFAGLGRHVHIMFGIAVVMTIIFCFVYFVPYMRLREAVRREEWPRGGLALAVIRRLIGLNLSLGLINVAVASGGVYWLAP